MWPTLFKIGNFEVTTFGLMMFLGFLAAGWVLSIEFKKRNFPEEVASSIVLAGLIGSILGGKIYYAILVQSWDALFSRAGLVYYGGLIGGAITVSIVILRSGLPYLRVADATAPALAIGYGLGRIGCFLVGDDYGRPTDSWVGIAFPEGLPPTTARSLRAFGVDVDSSIPGDAVLRVHPTQLYEAGAAFLIFGLLMWLAKANPRPGRLFGLFLVLLGSERFLVEIVRAKDDRFLGPFTIAQLISAILIVLGGWLIARSRARKEAPASG